MAKNIPITEAKTISQKHGFQQVIIVAWDSETSTTSVVTYGKSLEDCEQAAMGGNLVKKSLGWPDDKCNDAPYRAKKKDSFLQVNIINNFIDGVFTDRTKGQSVTKFELLKELEALKTQLKKS